MTWRQLSTRFNLDQRDDKSLSRGNQIIIVWKIIRGRMVYSTHLPWAKKTGRRYTVDNMKHILWIFFSFILYPLLTLNVPVPYKYRTHQWAAFEPHLNLTSRALPTRVPRTRAAVWRRPRNSHSHASRGSAHFHAFAGRSSAHFYAIGSRSSAHFHAIRSRRSANFDGFIRHTFPRIPAQW